MVARFNFASALAMNRLKGTKVNADSLLTGVDQGNRNMVAEKLTRVTVSGEVSSNTRQVLEKVLQTDTGTVPVAPTPNVSVGYDAEQRGAGTSDLFQN